MHFFPLVIMNTIATAIVFNNIFKYPASEQQRYVYFPDVGDNFVVEGTLNVYKRANTLYIDRCTRRKKSKFC